MSTYRDLFRTPEFKPLFISSSLGVAGTTVTGLALSTLVFAATGSALLAALGTAVLAVPGLPGWATALVILGIGLVNSVAGGVRWGLLGEIVSAERYLLGRSMFNMAVGVMQIAGYALGGLLVAVLSARWTLLIAVTLYLLAAAVARTGLSERAARSPGPAVGAADVAGQRHAVGVSGAARDACDDVGAERADRRRRGVVRPVRARCGRRPLHGRRVRDAGRRHAGGSSCPSVPRSR